MVATSLAGRFVSMLSLVVLARLLVPADFGMVALAVVVTSTAGLLASAGMGSALIASRADDRVATTHATVLNGGVGLVLTVVVAATAGPLADALGDERIAPLIVVLSPVLLLDTLAVVPEARLMKAIMFGRRAACHISAAVVQAGVAVALAVTGAGVWSLVAGHLAGAATRLLVSLLLTPRRTERGRVRWDASVARDLVGFGGTATVTTLVRHAYSNLDNVIVGRVLGTQALGFYSQAFTVTNLPVQSVSQVTNSVLMPVYTRIREDRLRLAEAYHASFRLVGTISLPMAVGLLLTAPDAIPGLLGDNWGPAVPVLQGLALMAIFRPLSGTTSPLFLAIRRPGLNLATAVVQGVIMLPLALVLVRYGAVGVAWAVSSAFAIGMFFNMWQVAGRTDVPVRLTALARGLVPATLATAGMAAVVWGLRSLLICADALPAGSLGLFLVAVVAGAVTYVAVLAAVDRRMLGDLVRMLRHGRGGARLPRARSDA